MSVFIAKMKDKVTVRGTVYERAKLGWLVPKYGLEGAIASIEDLKNEMKGRLKGGSKTPISALA